MIFLFIQLNWWFKTCFESSFMIAYNNWKDLFGSVLFTICLTRFFIFRREIIIVLILSLIWYVKLVKPTSIFTVVFLLLRSMITNPYCFSQAVLHNCLNSSLVMSLPTWSSKMWIMFFMSWGNRHEIRVLSDCLAWELDIVLS